MTPFAKAGLWAIGLFLVACVVLYPLAAYEGREYVEVENRSQAAISVTVSTDHELPTLPTTVSPGETKRIAALVGPTRYTLKAIDANSGRELCSLAIRDADKVDGSYRVVYPRTGLTGVK